MAFFTLPAALLSLAFAVPTSPPSCPVCTHDYDANFDDLATVPLDGPGEPAVPTPYKGLSYSSLVVASEALLPAIVYHSQPNAAVTNTLPTVFNQATVVLNAKYPASKVLDFTLRKFYFGCKTPSVQQGNGGLAVACTIVATGYKQDPQRPEVCEIVGPELFYFDPVAQGATLGLLGASQREAVLPSTFAGVTNVTLEVATSELPTQTLVNTTIVYYDSFQYSTREVCCKWW